METIGDLSGIAEGGFGREATDRELSGGVICDGLGSAFASLFGVLPNTSFSQNSVLSNSAPAILSSLSATTNAGQAQQGTFDLGSAASSGLLGGIFGDANASAASGMGLLGSLLQGQENNSESDGSSLLGLLLGRK